jgi:cytochrome c553
MRRWLWGLSLLLLLVAVALVGLMVAGSGVLQLRASMGHWAWVSALLHFGMRRSVATWSAGIEVPPLDDSALLVTGASYYESGCAPCHGRPGTRRPAFGDAMTPSPPELQDEVEHWEDEDLFYVVKHGVKFTGMPGWPDLSRDDEVWAAVAFLRELPRLDRARYTTLAYGSQDLEQLPPQVRDCARCHGTDGLGRGVFPRLAGQRQAYLASALWAYASQRRSSGVMQTATDELLPEQMDELARWFAALPPGPPWPAPEGAVLARGEAIATGQTQAPACAQCHGPSETERHPGYPLLASQDPGYLAQQLRLFRDGHRGGGPLSQLMEVVASHGLDDQQIEDVTAWYGTLPAEAPGQ